MEETYTENNKTSYTNVNNSKYYFDINDLLSFIFPKNLQHPLAAGRLFAFAMYGPLDNNNRIRSGIKGCRVVADYELDQMCQQFDKEDVICIYLHKRSDFGNLTSHEQSAIVSQADGHLKKEKGKAMLPAITKQDVIDILEDIPRNENGLLSFHDAQKVIMDYRDERIKQLKLVYPQLKQTKKADVSNTQTINENNLTITKKPKKRITRVDESIAPQTMFLHMKGMTNPDVIDQTTKFLSKHAFKISDVDQHSGSHLCANVRLLRDIPPKCPEPKSNSARPTWNNLSTMSGVGLGSMVDATASSTTWKRKATKY